MPQTPEQIASKLKQIKGRTSKQWGQLTEGEAQKIRDKRTALVDKMQKRYGQRDRQNPPAE